MTDSITLEVNQRILITEETKHTMPDGYNWVGSCPVITNLATDGHGVFVRQIGYPVGLFYIEIQDAIKMRQDYLNSQGRGE